MAYEWRKGDLEWARPNIKPLDYKTIKNENNIHFETTAKQVVSNK